MKEKKLRAKREIGPSASEFLNIINTKCVYNLGQNVWIDPTRHLCVTYLRVSLVLQVEQAKQLTHQALLRADTTDKNRRKHSHMRY